MRENLGDILKQVFEDIENGSMEKLKMKVVNVDNQSFNDFMDFRRKTRMMRDDMELKLKALELEYKRKAEEVIDPTMRLIEEENDKVWGKMYSKYKLDSNKEYSFNSSEKTIYQYIE